MTLLNLTRGFSPYKTQWDRILASVSLCPQKVAQSPPQSRPSTNLCLIEYMGSLLFTSFWFRCAVPEALKTIQKAEKVLLVHYGPWNDEIRELQKMKSCLLDLLPIPVGPKE